MIPLISIHSCLWSHISVHAMGFYVLSGLARLEAALSSFSGLCYPLSCVTFLLFKHCFRFGTTSYMVLPVVTCTTACCCFLRIMHTLGNIRRGCADIHA